jgi:hypothetical protein
VKPRVNLEELVELGWAGVAAQWDELFRSRLGEGLQP